MTDIQAHGSLHDNQVTLTMTLGSSSLRLVGPADLFPTEGSVLVAQATDGLAEILDKLVKELEQQESDG